MNLYEYEGKDLLRKEGIPVPQGKIISSLSEISEIEPPIVVKA